ncbi:MAG: T9SS type A sorting domain-containing protein [Muribaculaceae bacterium]|nr:T9SS type A sorting domain-containing protein [Muribaculaceae bacterium]
MRKLRNITIAFFIGLMGISSSVVYANPANDEISIITSSQPSIKTSEGAVTLIVTSDETVNFQIFSITGQVVKTATVSHGSATIELPKGYYIVKCIHWSKSVIVK